MQPDYDTPYGIPAEAEVKAVMDRILRFLEDATPARVVDAEGQECTDLAALPADAKLVEGKFRLTSYEWGVTYAAMVAATEATGDPAYSDYMARRLRLIASVAPHFGPIIAETPTFDTQMRRVLAPSALDDAGAMASALVRMQLSGGRNDIYEPLISRYVNYVRNQEYRLPDGTFARNRPHRNTVWLDDMYMGVPCLAWYGRYKNDPSYIHEAVSQIRLFKDKMWVPERQLFRHGWVEDMTPHPAFHWGRANGWAILTMCEVLDAMGPSHPDRAFVLDLLRQHIEGLAVLQDKTGFWHQLLDRNDTYLETSCTAIYAYCIAHAINEGWVDALAYGANVLLAWNAVASQVDASGLIHGTCVGTGMGFDAAFYAYRPVHTMAAHGYGPAIWAGSEVIRMLHATHPKMNDSAVHFYPTEQKTTEPIFSEGVTEGEIF